MSNQLGNFIRETRTRRRAMSIRDLAHASSCTWGYISLCENGKVIPSPEMVTRWERALKLPPGRLVRHVRLLRTPPDVLALIDAETVRKFLEG